MKTMMFNRANREIDHVVGMEVIPGARRRQEKMWAS
jgi:hypothetical protein